MDFQTAAKIGSLLAKDYAEGMFALLSITRASQLQRLPRV